MAALTTSYYKGIQGTAPPLRLPSVAWLWRRSPLASSQAAFCCFAIVYHFPHPPQSSDLSGCLLLLRNRGVDDAQHDVGEREARQVAQQHVSGGLRNRL